MIFATTMSQEEPTLLRRTHDHNISFDIVFKEKWN